MITQKSHLLSTHKNITHAFTTIHGGVSKTPYKSNNIAFHVNDNKDNVLHNHQRLSKTLKYDLQHLAWMEQVHGDAIVTVHSSENFSNPPICDALICNQKNVPLMVMVADCIPILLFDPVKEVIAAVHAGRQGAFLNIAGKTIKKMQHTFDCNPNTIRTVLGPSIGSCCYEMPKKHAQEHGEFDYAYSTKNGKLYLDIKAIVIKQLLDSCVIEQNIENIATCTCCNSDTYFSYRASNGVTGRFAGVIMMKQ